jgi:hypothetical protein
MMSNATHLVISDRTTVALESKGRDLDLGYTAMEFLLEYNIG